MGLSRRRLPLLIVALMACRADPVADYATVLSEPGLREPAACEGLPTEELLGDCALVVAERRLAARELAETVCAEVPPGRWRFECFFVAAEAAAADSREGRAAALCQQAGSFREDCAQHLWQDALYRLARRPRQRLSALEVLATPLHDRWSGHLRWTEGFSARFWEHAFGLAFVGAVLDLERCQEVSSALQPACIAGGVSLFERELAPALARTGMDLCALPARADALGPALVAVSHPTLDGVVTARKRRLCPSGP